MGVTTKTIRIVTCDLCEKECGEDDCLSVRAGRFVGTEPVLIRLLVRLDIPYQPNYGILCRGCTVDALRKCLAKLEKSDEKS